MYIRKFKQEDLCRIEQIHSFLAVQIKYHNGIRNENIVCVIKDELIIGIGFLIIHQTRNLQKTEVTYSASPDGDSKYNKKIRDLLMDGLLKRFRELKEANLLRYRGNRGNAGSFKKGVCHLARHSRVKV